jgi:hypothetical protein
MFVEERIREILLCLRVAVEGVDDTKLIYTNIKALTRSLKQGISI